MSAEDAGNARHADEAIALLEETSLEISNDIKPRIRGSISAEPTTTVSEELWVYARYMAPLLVNQGLQRYCMTFAPISAMGRYGAVSLAAASLATSTTNILCHSIILGMSSALDTLSTQAVGSQSVSDTLTQDLNMLYTLRVVLCIGITYLVILPILWSFRPIFEYVGVDSEAARLATTYIRWSLLGLPGYVGYEGLRKYCSAQGKMGGPAVAVAAGTPFVMLVIYSNIAGQNTPPLSLGVFWSVAFVAECVYAYIVFDASTWASIPPFKQVRQDLHIVFKLGGAGVISSCSDWFAWEYLSFVAATLGNEVLAANGVLLTSTMTLCAIPASLSNAVPTRIGNFLGAGLPADAQLSANTAVWLSISIGLFSGLVLFMLSDAWCDFFTNDPKVVGIVERVIPAFCVVVAFDAYQNCFAAILRGAGLPMKIASTMLTAHYLVGMPLATLFALLFDWGLFGLWGGFCIGLILVIARLWWLIAHNDWAKVAREAEERTRATELNAAAFSGDMDLLRA